MKDSEDWDIGKAPVTVTVITQDGELVATFPLPPGPDGNPSQKHLDRACLAAHAPRLLEALKLLLEDVGYNCDANECECGQFVDEGLCIHTLCHRTIAKATGRDS